MFRDLHLGKCRNITPIRPRPIPANQLPIQQSPTIPPSGQYSLSVVASKSDNCKALEALDAGFSPEYFGFPLSVSFHRCSITCKNEKTDHLSVHLHHMVAQ